MSTTIGSILKQTRKAQGLTQQVVASGICSQAMLSAIEHDKYIPNVALTLALCQRLGLSLETLSLAENYAISQTPDLNAKLDHLCNSHQYKALLAFLQDPATLATITTSTQTEAYYYYLSIAEYQTHNESAMTHIKLALAQHVAGTPLTALDRLCFATKAVLEVAANQTTDANHDFATAFQQLETTPYVPNLNILFYLHALTAYQAGDYLTCAKRIQAGIDFATAHGSHYMLANDYYLLAEAAQKLADVDTQREASQRAAIFKDLFGVQIFRDF